MLFFFFFKQKTAYEMRISDWSSDVCSSDLLYQIHDRSGNGKSLGRMDAAREAEFQKYRQQKAELKERGALLSAKLAESAALYRALRLPLLSSDAGPILRECDRRDLLGSHLLVVGRSEGHTSELQSLMRISYAVFSLQKKNNNM